MPTRDLDFLVELERNSFGINVEVVWDVVQHKLSELEEAAKTLLGGAS